MGTALAIAALLAVAALLLLPPHAHGNFVYWGNSGQTSIGRAKLNGTGVNNAFIGGLSNVHGVAVDSKHVYWTQGNAATSSIGRANLDGSGANPNFIPNSAAVNFATAFPQAAVAVTSSALYWVNTGAGTIGRANLDGTSPNGALVNPGGDPLCGIATDQNFIYWVDVGLGQSIGRAGQDGSNPTFNFVPGVSGSCGVAVDGSFLYWGATANAVGRAPVGGGAGSANNAFIPNAASPGNTTCGVAINSQFIFWGNSGATDFIGRANLNGNSPNPGLIAGPTDPCLPAAAPSNKITINSITRKKKKGTAIINAKVPGPGQAGLLNTKPPTTAGSAKVKQQALTLGAASSFKLAVKAKGSSAKKLKKKGKATVTVYATFTPAGVAGVESSKKLTIHLVKTHKKKKH